MANKKISELESRASLSLSDLMAVGDPSTGYLYKTTISDLKTLTGAGVVSFNGRFGTVNPAEGDYTLTQLGDVIITSPSNGQVLKYNGSNWVNATEVTEADTLDTVTTRGNTTGNSITVLNLSATGLIVSSGAVYSNVGFYSNNNGNLRYTFDGNNLVMKAGTSTSNTYMTVFGATGNVLIGSGSDAGYKLDVVGGVRVGTDGLYATNGTTTAPLIKFNTSNLVHIDAQGYGAITGATLSVGGQLSNNGYLTSTNYHMVKGGSTAVNTPFMAYGIGRPDADYSLQPLSGIGGYFAGAAWYNGAGLTFYTSNGTDISGGANLAEAMRLTPAGVLSVTNLSGTGSRMVVANASGVLSTQAIPDLTGYVTLDTFQTITASKTFSVGFSLASAGGANQLTSFANTNSIHSGSAGSNIFGFNSSNNIYFGKGLSNGGVIGWNNSTVRSYTLPDATGTIALTSDIPSVAGVYLPLSGGTLTGGLILSPASGAASITMNAPTGQLNEIVFKVNSTNVGWMYVNASYFQFNSNTTSGYLFKNTAGANILAMTDAGAATFSSSVTAATLNTSSSASSLAAFNSTDANGGYIRFQRSGTDIGFIGSAYHLFSGSNSNADLGIRSDGNLIISAGGSGEKVRVTSAGELCVGRTSAYGAGFLVNVQGNIYASAAIVAGSTIDTGGRVLAGSAGNTSNAFSGINNSVAQATIYAFNHSASGYAFYSGQGINYFANNVGIGTASPNSTLHVAGTFRTVLQSGAGGQTLLSAISGVTNGYEILVDTSNNITHTWNTGANVAAMRITPAGLVGIGTTSPQGSYMLTIAGDTSSKTGGICFRQSSTDTFYMGNPTVTNTTDFEFWNPRNGYVRFATNNAEAMRITSAGDIGVGATSGFNSISGTEKSIHIANNNVASLYLNSTGTGKKYILYSGATGSFVLYDGTAGAARLVVDTNGVTSITSNYNSYKLFEVINTNNTSGNGTITSNLGANCNNTSSYHFIGYTGSADRVYIYGNGNIVNSNNSYGALSDIRLKENITDTTSKLADLLKVKVRNYNLIGDDKKQIGVIAQELETVFPGMIEVDGKSGMKQVKYSVFVPMLIKAMQEQQAQIEQLKNK